MLNGHSNAFARLAAAALAVAVAVTTVPVQAADKLTGRAVLEAVAKGGYVVFIRHTKTDDSQKDADVSDLTNCGTQRNLSQEGKDQAKMIGDGFKKLGVQADKVISSPYCRALDTAMLMFGRGDKAPELSYLTRMKPEEAAAASAWLKKQLSAPPAPGKNNVLISHTANLKSGTGIWPKSAGDINVFKPNGDGTFTHVGTFTAAEWAALKG